MHTWNSVIAYHHLPDADLSFCEFLKAYFSAIVDGRTDYENLTPSLLG